MNQAIPMTDTLAAPAYRLPPLSWLRAFEATARHLSFTKAALELNLTQAAVSHQVRSLERQLGVQLFERLARSLKLTETGAAYLPPVRRSFEDLAAATDGLFGPVGTKTLTIRAPASFVVLWLAPRLGRFAEMRPDISIRIASVVWAQTTYDEPVDVDIRYGDGHWPGHKVEPLMPAAAIVVCRPETAPAGTDAERLAHFAANGSLIHVTGYEDLWQRLAASFGTTLPRMTAGINVDTTMAALELSAARLGPAIVEHQFAEPYLSRGLLVRALETALPIREAHFFATPEGRTRSSVEANAFKAWLRAEAVR